MKRFFACLICAILLCNFLPTTAFAAEEVTASTMQLVKCEGEVTVKKVSLDSLHLSSPPKTRNATEELIFWLIMRP